MLASFWHFDPGMAILIALFIPSHSMDITQRCAIFLSHSEVIH
jgi:hypothetical protein